MLVLGAVSAALAAGCFFYAGPGHALVRGHLGDVAATMLLYAALGLIWRARLVWRAAGAAAIALALELHQLLEAAAPTRSVAGELVLGSFFDGWDLVAYAIGLGLAVLWERYSRRRLTSTSHTSSAATAAGRGSSGSGSQLTGRWLPCGPARTTRCRRRAQPVQRAGVTER